MKNKAHILLGLAVGWSLTTSQASSIKARPLVRSSLFVAALDAQGGNSISGHVFGESHRPVPDVYVELINDTYSTIGQVRTDGSGFYSLRNVPQGTFKVRVRPYGTDYLEQTQEVVIQNISLVSGAGHANEQLDFTLRARPDSYSSSPFASAGTIFVQEVPTDARKNYEQGVSNLRDKKEKEGYESLKKSIEIFPTYFAALDRLGIEYVMHGQYEAGRMLLVKAIEVNPRSYSSLLGIGMAQFHLNQNKEALESLRRATTFYAKEPTPFLYMGMALKRDGQLEQAEAAYKKANLLGKGKFAEAHWQIARLYNEQKRYREAADELELFLKNQTDLRDADKLREAIKQLRAKAATQ